MHTAQSLRKYIITTLNVLKKIARLLRDALWSITSSDVRTIVIILILAAITRLPALGTPHITEFDEVIYISNTLHVLQGIPFVDTHPPLARIFFAGIAYMYTPFHIQTIEVRVGEPFGDFPYVPLRTGIAIVGILLILIMYAIPRMLGQHPRMAILPALFIIFDNALTVYARTILPDTLLLLCEFTAVALVYTYLKSKTQTSRVSALIGAGIMLGFALSIKWLALGVLATLLLALLLYRRVRASIAIVLVMSFVYIFVFTSYLMLLMPHGGVSDNIASDHIHQTSFDITFPEMHSIGDALKFLPSYHKVMFASNSDKDMLRVIPHELSPYAWPTAQAMMQFWSDEKADGRGPTPLRRDVNYIILFGNNMLWSAVFFVFVFNFMWTALQSLAARRVVASKEDIVFMFGYLINYLPFFFIHRQMFLYHYFTALLFLFLLIPSALPRARHCLELLTHDRWFSYTFFAVALFLVLIVFISGTPLTYGKHFW